MAAGLGFKDFTTGEVLTAADVDGYLMQGIWVFASAAARDAAVTSPQEGNFAFLKDTNTTTYYTGSAWTNLDTTGMVNPMTTTGDTIYSSSGSTPARLGIGTAGQVLQVNSGATAPEWATPAGGGGMTLLETITLSGASTTSSTLSTSYKQFFLYIKNAYNSTNAQFRLRFNGDTGSNYSYGLVENGGPEVLNSQTQIRICNIGTTSSGQNSTNAFVTIMIPSQTNEVFVASQGQTEMSGIRTYSTTGIYDSSAAITTINFTPNTGTFSGGTVYIYGVN